MKFLVLSILGLSLFQIAATLQPPRILQGDDDLTQLNTNFESDSGPQQTLDKKKKSSKKTKKSKANKSKKNGEKTKLRFENKKTGGLDGIFKGVFDGDFKQKKNDSKFFVPIFDTFSKIHQQFNSGLGKFLKGIFGGMESNIGGIFKPLFGGMISGKFGLDLIGNIITFCSQLLSGGLDLSIVGKLLQMIINICIGMVTGVTGMIDNMFGSIFKDGGSKISQSTKSMITVFNDGIKSMDFSSENRVEQLNDLLKGILVTPESQTTVKKVRQQLGSTINGVGLTIDDEGYVQTDQFEQADEDWQEGQENGEDLDSLNDEEADNDIEDEDGDYVDDAELDVDQDGDLSLENQAEEEKVEQ